MSGTVCNEGQARLKTVATRYLGARQLVEFQGQRVTHSIADIIQSRIPI
jgi:hypothetical protein